MSINLTNKNYCATIVKITKLIDLDKGNIDMEEEN